MRLLANDWSVALCLRSTNSAGAHLSWSLQVHSLYLSGASTPPLRCARRQWTRALSSLATAALSVCLTGLAAAQAPQSLLTLEAALEIAQERSEALQAQDAATRAAREMAISAGRLPDPVLRLSINNLPIEGPMRYSLTGERMTMRSVEIMVSGWRRHVDPSLLV